MHHLFFESEIRPLAGPPAGPDVGLALCPHLHGLGRVHHARVPQKEVRRTAHKSLPLSRLAPSLYLLQNCRKSDRSESLVRRVGQMCPQLISTLFLNSDRGYIILVYIYSPLLVYACFGNELLLLLLLCPLSSVAVAQELHLMHTFSTHLDVEDTKLGVFDGD